VIRELRWPFGRNRARPLDPADVQGDILQPYGFAVSAHLFVAVAAPESGRAIVDDALARITNGSRWSDKPESTLNVAFTAAGLTAIGMPTAIVDSFPPAFLEGMAARATILGDVGRSAPERWDEALGTGAAHLLFTVNAVDERACEAAVRVLRQSLDRHGSTVLADQRGRRLPDRKEHFGYTDGVGQPSITGALGWRRAARRVHHWLGVPVGEIFHGYVDADGYPAPGPAAPFGTGGTFKVWRKLHEDVATFRRWIAEQAEALEIDETLLRAKLIGRWPDASPLVLAPERPDPELADDADRVNDFDYLDDPDGLRCPLGAHIRRTNPRSGLGFGDALSARQRIIRRGMTYGPAVEEGVSVDDGVDRGIFFVAYMADIERQFEFIQANWCNDGDTVRVGHDPDPFVGRVTADHKFVIPGDPPRFVHPLPELVTTKGGEYLWAPSIEALGRIATGDWADDARRRRPGSGGALRAALGTALGVLLAPIAWIVSFLRGGRVVHTHGAGYTAELVLHGSTAPEAAGTVLATAASMQVPVRLSRGYGRPFDKPDVHGLALRIDDAGDAGRPQDLLLSSAARGGRRDRTATSTGYGSLLSSTLPLGAPNGPIVVRATAVGQVPDDAVVHQGGASGAAFDLEVARPGAEGTTVGRLTLGEALSPDDAEALAFSVRHDAGGIWGIGVLHAARAVAYRAGQAGRAARRRR